MQDKASTIEEYIAQIPEDRQETFRKVREVILAHLPAGYEEGIVYDMPGYYIPLSRYPNTYNGQPIGIAALASQKNYLSLYLTGIYDDSASGDWFRQAYEATGKKLNMGKSCVRFKKLDDLPLEVIGQAIARFTPDELIAVYEKTRHFKG